MQAKYERMKAGAPRNVFVDPTGYKEYVDSKQQAFRKTLEEQK